jgi:arylsulfatase A-like enzyme
LRIGDQALEKVLAHLEERGLADSTLVVVIGDHGESFGEHGGWAHDNIYDQCLRVPLMFINPRLFHGEVYRQIGSSVDVAPTIFDILGQKLPGAWQGRSLFSANRTGRAYSFSPFSGYMFGIREGDYACLFNASREKYEIYNMVSDPYQKKNLASQQPKIASQATERLAGWAQYQNGYIDKLVASPNRSVPSVADAIPQAKPQ